MKLVAIIESVNQKGNKNLIGDIVIVDSKLRCDRKDVLCYIERGRFREFNSKYNLLQCLVPQLHEVSNVTIIGVL